MTSPARAGYDREAMTLAELLADSATLDPRIAGLAVAGLTVVSRAVKRGDV